MLWIWEKKVIRGITENALEGKFNGERIPLGFKRNDSTLAINEEEGNFVC